MRRVCVFCGSSTGARPAYAQAAADLAAELVRRGLGLVTGGGSVGLMGVVADAMLALGGEVIGVIPRPLATKELAHEGLTELRVVETMHERKATMAALADGFVALPGGLGTLEETLEVLTWAQLGIHGKPVGVLDVAGYWQPLAALLASAVREGFATEENVGLLVIADTPTALLDRFAAFRPPPPRWRWLELEQT
jgi:uncharacterized protein (TIGR00730 family)